jgi:ribosomal protein S12 methylthiotransferase accessory factor
MVLGPEGETRTETDAFLKTALAAAGTCGVTRLADITRLDRLGFPVWQAVRPAGRSLSVHQGKGESPESAQIGALCEALESHCAEVVPADGPLCLWSELPARQRAPDMTDYCWDRSEPPEREAPIQWCVAADLLTGDTQFLPHPLVSLDYTCGLPSAFDRTSNGLGAGRDEAGALSKALLELIERDAVGEWHRLDQTRRMATALAPDSIPFDWFRSWRGRLAELDVALQVFRLQSIVSVPVFMCVIGGVEEFGQTYRRFSGAAAHGDPERALFGALAEAMQSRLAIVAGVRDDILPSYYTRRSSPAPADDTSPGPNLVWEEVQPVPCDAEALAESLATLGYTRAAWKRLDGGMDVVVTKVFVPGLGSFDRTPRGAR